MHIFILIVICSNVDSSVRGLKIEPYINLHEFGIFVYMNCHVSAVLGNDSAGAMSAVSIHIEALTGFLRAESLHFIFQRVVIFCAYII